MSMHTFLCNILTKDSLTEIYKHIKLNVNILSSIRIAKYIKDIKI